MKLGKPLLTLLLGLASTVSQGQILIGQTAGFSGPVASGVKEITTGATLYIDAVNAKGGVAGQKIELISLDDKFDPKLAADNARQLIEEKNVAALFLNRGTPHTEAIIPLLEKHGVPLIAPSTGAMSLHQPVRKYVFNVRATYQREAEKIITHMAIIGMSRIAVVYADDSFGQDALAGAQKGFAGAKLTPVLLEKFDRSKPDLSNLAPTIAKADAQAVLIVGAGSVTADCVKLLRAVNRSIQIATLSNNASEGFIKSLGEQGRGVIVSQVFPQTQTYGLVKEAYDVARAKGLSEVSPAMLEGFAAAKVLVEALRKASPKPTRERIQTALEGLSKFDIGGLEVKFSPQDHTGLDFADLSIISSDGKFRR